MPKTAKPWERQVGETEKQYKAFAVYRDAGEGRQIRATYRLVYGKPKKTKAPGWFTSWPKRNHWVDRARAYDNQMVQAEQKDREKLVSAKAAEWAKIFDEHKEIMIQASRRLIERANQMIATPLFKTEIIEAQDGNQVHLHPNKNWSPRDAAKLLETGDKLMRLVGEMPTSRIEVHYEIKWDKLSDEQLRRIAKGEEPSDVAPELVH